MIVRPLGPEDHDWVLALNARHVVETGPLDRAALEAGLARAFHAAVAEPQAATPGEVEATARLAPATIPRAVGPPIFLRLLALLV